MKPGLRLRSFRLRSLRLRFFVLLIFLFGVAGCGGVEGTPVRAAVETHVRADGGAERRVAVDANSPGPSLGLTRSWSLDAGVDVTERSAAAGRSYQLSGDGSEASSGGMSLRVEDNFFWRDFEFSDRLEGPLAEGRRFTGGAGYKLVMPGEISAAPGAARTSGGVTIYDIDTSENSSVRAESRMVRWWAVFGTAGGLVAVAALILGGRAAEAVRGIPRWLWTGRWS